MGEQNTVGRSERQPLDDAAAEARRPRLEADRLVSAPVVPGAEATVRAIVLMVAAAPSVGMGRVGMGAVNRLGTSEGRK